MASSPLRTAIPSGVIRWKISLLRLQNARPAAQVLNVGVADVGDHRHIRAAQSAVR